MTIDINEYNLVVEMLNLQLEIQRRHLRHLITTKAEELRSKKEVIETLQHEVNTLKQINIKWKAEVDLMKGFIPRTFKTKKKKISHSKGI